MTKVNVISGFLGAGKTTLIRKLVSEVFTGQKVVLVENEFGQVGIDGSFLKEAGIEIREINSGCICCTLKGDFEKALAMVVEQYHPDRILIEPSGVGKLSDILRAIRTVDGLQIDSYSTVVDAKRCAIYHKNFREFFDDQIQTATCVILSRTQEIDQDRLQADVDIIRQLNPDARIITTPWDQLSGQAIFDAMTGSTDGYPADLGEDEDEDEDEEHEHEHDHEDHDHEHEHDDAAVQAAANAGLSAGNKIYVGEGDEEEHEHHHHHHHDEHDADEVFDSIGMETINQYSREDLEQALQGLGDNIVRAKGIVPEKNTGKWLFFDYVPGDVDIREGSAAYTGLITIIGEKVDIDQMKRLFGIQ